MDGGMPAIQPTGRSKRAHSPSPPPPEGRRMGVNTFRFRATA
eukprot:CAMPEP_0119274832 /NCGR_PEP_ID=MMETSP1329-20130426/12750_1 /TAXON_ID=114041 /ORGANISM="Genus nov. species nov., Strain RCC1024" /LENGTH=41 /DNA_ID= /DNA_START= /DNA_END= /DNA_ORIENTATION=